jgi:galactitol-specific phosphotransferase system IIC component
MVLAYVGDAGNDCQYMPKLSRVNMINPLTKLVIAMRFIFVDFLIDGFPLFLKFQFDPDCLATDFAITSESQLLAVILCGKLKLRVG